MSRTLRRYVTRAGQGGRQTNQDRSGKVASSAGSALRRYNESALTRDVAATLTAWAPRLAAADAVFVNAPGASAAPVAEGLAAAGVGRRDARIRRVPFPTARPTFRELRRAVLRLAAAEEGTGAAAAAAAAPAAAAGAVECAAAAAAAPAAPVGQAVAGGGGGGIWAEPAEEVSAEALAEAKAKVLFRPSVVDTREVLCLAPGQRKHSTCESMCLYAWVINSKNFLYVGSPDEVHTCSLLLLGHALFGIGAPMHVAESAMLAVPGR